MAVIKPFPQDFYDQFLSDLARGLKPSAIRSLYPLEKKPGVISLLAGKPNSSTFPFTSLSFTAKDPTSESAETTISIPQAQLAPGLQYSDTAGIPDLLAWLTGLQERIHGRNGGSGSAGENPEGWRISIGTGSQDLISKSAAMLINPGDSIFVEAPVYAGVLPIFRNLRANLIEVPTDAYGIRSSALKEMLENWPEGKTKPKLLYTVPYGCNPTGMTASTERRKEVLKLAREHNFLILEDDPYFYLYFGIAPRPPSYFSLEASEPEPSGEDADTGEVHSQVGRVLRFDSFSKVLSAGLRVGFASGPEPILRRVDVYTATTNLQPSSLTQLIVFQLLQSWGYDNFLLHTRKVSAFYKEKRDVFEREMQKWLGGGGKLAEWVTPEAGMFFWFKLVINPPSATQSNATTEGVEEAEEDSKTLIETHAYANGVLALPGTVFSPSGSKTAYVRASFSLLDEEQVVETMRRLRRTVLEVRRARREAGVMKGVGV
ncbi:hypothetical protein GYMLUDRAFT_167942 [Collybiopsis luxurians FD-317 M1]|uniref:Unplaced genomic scaffold GYMLUscaffold_27, whole genome shotgun sequence n=1 Tax=Collybiopsis luxurians FD-317 M1 TaxID=944289 RepID=A0A0D0B9X7_9AGAR|nr:hypothetical protein GYMLUDRAFT_167942 [Collybiopsis luxurians FD-317 M1]